MRFFISFSSRDLPSVRELMSGFKSQQIDFWDYSNEIEEIEAGELIDSRLVKEISKADFFIAIISNYSTNPEIGKFTHTEVQHAIDLGMLEKGKIIPVELQRKNDRLIFYQGSYKKLELLLHLNFELQNFNSFISILEAVTQRIKLPYIPLIEAHPRLPFRDKFRNEVMELAHSNSSHVHLMTSLGKFNECMKANLIRESFNEIDYFITSACYTIPGYKPVYPYIVKAVCLQELGEHSKAGESYVKALENDPENPDALGGLGMVSMYHGDYVKAADYFDIAAKNSDPVQARNERVSKVIAVLSGRLNQRYFNEDKEFVLNIPVDNLESEDEKVVVLKAKALIYYHDRQFSKAESMYHILEISKQLDDTGSIIYYYLTKKLNGSANPQEVLKNGIISSEKIFSINAVILWEYLAGYYAEEGNIHKAVTIFKDHLLPPHQKERSLMASYALLLKQAGEDKLCRETCEQILSPAHFGNPESFSDFYYCGLANFIKGNQLRAEYDFERSNGFGQEYEKLLINHKSRL